MTLYFKCLYYDQRGVLYRRHCGILDSGKDSDVLELTRMIAYRIEGTVEEGGGDRPARLEVHPDQSRVGRG